MRNKVLIVQNKHIRDLNISPLECVDWIDESFRMKYNAQLPAKISVHPQGNDFLLLCQYCYLLLIIILALRKFAE